jgi:CubicO group peptidase (beta-lactamase class C family)
MKNILLLLLLSTTAYAQQDTLDQLVTAYTNAGRFSGSVLVARQGHILLEKGYDSSNTANTMYQVASITKQFTAYVVMRLASEHKLSLTDPLSKFYPGFPKVDSIIIEQMLQHTSGIHNYTETNEDITGGNEQQLIAFLTKTPLDFSPGSSWHYSNSNYALLGHIIGKVSGMSYWQAVRHYIFTPMHMTHSGFDFTHLKDPNKAHTNDPNVLDSTKPFSAGGIYSTVGDLYRWHQGLQKQQDFMKNAYVRNKHNNYGYGWQIDSMFNKRVVSHSGSINGFGSNIARVTDDDVCIVILSNRGGSTSAVINLTNVLLAVLYHQPYTIPVKKVPIKLSEAELQKYTGTYVVDSQHLVIDFKIESGELIGYPHGGPRATLLTTDGKTFYIKEDEDFELIFEENKVLLKNHNITRIAKKSGT